MLFVLGTQKYNQNNLATLLNFSDQTLLTDFFGHDLSFRVRVRACTSRPVYIFDAAIQMLQKLGLSFVPKMQEFVVFYLTQ